MLSLLKQGDHLVMSQFVFGNTHSFANTLTGPGVEVTMVDVTDVRQVEKAIQPNTRAIL